VSKEGKMTVRQLRRALVGLLDDGEVLTRVVSAPFDDETVELIDVQTDSGCVVIAVAVVDDVAREMRAEDEAGPGM
jgi:hypothetical protein